MQEAQNDVHRLAPETSMERCPFPLVGKLNSDLVKMDPYISKGWAVISQHLVDLLIYLFKIHQPQWKDVLSFSCC